MSVSKNFEILFKRLAAPFLNLFELIIEIKSKKFGSLTSHAIFFYLDYRRELLENFSSIELMPLRKLEWIVDSHIILLLLMLLLVVN